MPTLIPFHVRRGFQRRRSWTRLAHDAAGRLMLVGSIAFSISIVQPGEAHASSLAPRSSPESWTRPHFRCAGVAVSPSKDLQNLIDTHDEGTTFCLSRGVYRLENGLSIKSRDALIGAPGAIINGSKRVGSWSREGDRWVATGQTQESPPVGDCKGDYTGCAYSEDLYRDGRPLWQVTDLADLSRGKFYFDYGNDKIYVADDPTDHKMEATVASKAVYGTGTYGATRGVRLKGLIFEKFGTPAQDSAVGPLTNGVFVGNQVRLNHGIGVAAGSGGEITNNWIHHNGQVGVSAPGSTDALFVGNEISHNNTMGFYTGWEAGSSKFSGTTGLVFRRNYVHHNTGSGPWLDTNNYRYLIEGNWIIGNSTDGIIAEISYDGIIRKNVIRDNGHCTGCWGAGILIANSSGVDAYGNHLSKNKEAVLMTMYARSEVGRLGPYDLRDNYVHDNTIALAGGQVGLRQYVDDTSYYGSSKGNRFDFNHYEAGSRSMPFAWDDGSLTFRQFRRAGQERHGTWSR
jgi:Right handed beta helix region